MGLCCGGIDTNLAAHSATIHSFQETSIPRETGTVKKQDDKNDTTVSYPSYGNGSRPHQTFSKEAIHVMYDFWTDHIKSLSTEKKTQIGVLLYSHLFCTLAHSRQIFLSCGTVESVGWKLLDHIQEMIWILHEHPENEWMKELQQLASTHHQWGIRYGNYQQFLHALHSTFEEHFRESKVYSLRVKYSLENIFTNAAVAITGRDFSILFRDRVDDFLSLEFLDSLEICLSHTTGREYFNRYLEQSFCTEYVAFLRNFDDFKRLASSTDRFEKAAKIYQEHFSLSAAAHINVPDHEHVIQLESTLNYFAKNCKDGEKFTDELSLGMDAELFDNLYRDIKKSIEQDIWPNFVSAIHSIKEITRPQSI